MSIGCLNGVHALIFLKSLIVVGQDFGMVMKKLFLLKISRRVGKTIMVWMIPLDLFDEKCIRDMEAVAQYIDAYSGDQTRDDYPSYEKCLRYFLESSSLEECRRRVDAYCQEYQCAEIGPFSGSGVTERL